MTTSSGGSSPDPVSVVDQSTATEEDSASNTVRFSLTARLAPPAGLLATAGLLLSLVSVRLAILEPAGAFISFAFFLVFGVFTTLCLSVAGLILTSVAGGYEGRSNAWTGAAFGVGLLTILTVLLAGMPNAPGIHDITTDISDPPSFGAALQITANKGRNLTYPHGGIEVPALQRQHYPDIAPIYMDLTMPAAMESAANIANKLGWTVLNIDEQAGWLEAYAVTRYFRFIDDVVVRVRPRRASLGVRIDLRSTSRVGHNDFGTNAARIREFAAAMRSLSQHVKDGTTR